MPGRGGPCGVPAPQAARPTCFGVDAEGALQQVPNAFADVNVKAREAVLQHDLPVCIARHAPPGPCRPLRGQAGQGAAGWAAPTGAAPRPLTRVRSILPFSSSQRCTESRFLGNSPCSGSRCCGRRSRLIVDTADPTPPAQTLPLDPAQRQAAQRGRSRKDILRDKGQHLLPALWGAQDVLAHQCIRLEVLLHHADRPPVEEQGEVQHPTAGSCWGRAWGNPPT